MGQYIPHLLFHATVFQSQTAFISSNSAILTVE